MRRLGDHIENLGETKTAYARRLGLPIPSITRYCRGQRGLASENIRIILDDAGDELTLNDLVPNPYKDNGAGQDKATKKITL